MDELTTEETRIIKVLTDYDMLNLSNIAEYSGINMNTCRVILEDMIDRGYAFEADDEEYGLVI